MEIKNFKKLDKGCLKASFRLCTTVYDAQGNKQGDQWADCTYFEKGNTYWLNPCAKMFEARDGSKKSYCMLGWDKELQEKINRAVRDKIRAGDYKEQAPKEEKPSYEDECPF
jgi:hypothetical protein